MARLALAELCGPDGSAAKPLGSRCAGTHVCAISAVGDPGAFRAQLESAGAVVRSVEFPDHHAFYARRKRPASRPHSRPARAPVCTLKDYVKLAALWPRQATPLWYVSQRLSMEENGGAVNALVETILRARSIPRPGPPTRPFLAIMTDLRRPTSEFVRPDKDRFLG